MNKIENFKETFGSDRFIPKRNKVLDYDYKILKENKDLFNKNSTLENIFPFTENNLLNFKVNNPKNNSINFMKQKPNGNERVRRDSKIIKNGESQVLDIPGFKNDYYLNLIDILDEKLYATILSSSVFIFNRKNNKVALLDCLENYENVYQNNPTSVKFNPKLVNKLAVGLQNGKLQIVDWTKNRVEIDKSVHSSRIGCFDWNPKAPTLVASGSKDKKIKLFDIRSKKAILLQNNFHFGEICGIHWNSDGYQLASGGNDNLINIWDLRKMKKPTAIIDEHKAAVRAIKWCPWKNNLLASGGGSGDMRLLIHNSDKGKTVKEIHTSSQVCAVVWDSDARILLTSHGFSKYQMCLWDYEKEDLLYEFMGHKNRILSLLNAEGTNTYITASADETLRVWDLSQYIKPLVRNNTTIKPLQLR
jgi:WD40 repeat protein